MKVSFKVVDARIDACCGNSKLVFYRVSSLWFPVSAVRHPAEIPASTTPNQRCKANKVSLTKGD
jgi:hypothetical protein